MKIEGTAKAMLDGLRPLNSVTPSRPTKPILSHVLIEAQEGSVTARATNLEMGMCLPLHDITVVEPGVGAPPFARLCAMLDQLGDEAVSLATDETTCRLVAPNAKLRLPVEAAEDFPAFPEAEAKTTFEMERADFEQMVAKTAFAAQQCKHRYALNAVHFLGGDRGIEMWATDGRHLATTLRRAKGLPEFEVLLPLPLFAAVRHLPACATLSIGLVPNGEGDLTSVTVAAEDARLFARLVEGHFPKWESLVRQEQPAKARVDRKALLDAVRLGALGTDEESNILRFTIDVTRGTTLGIGAESHQGRSAQVELPVTDAKDSLNAGYGSDYLSRMLSAATADVLALGWERQVYKDPERGGPTCTTTLLAWDAGGWRYTLQSVSDAVQAEEPRDA